MGKYTEQFRLTATKAYLEGNLGFRRIAQEFKVDVSLLRRWVSLYQIHGVTNLSTLGQQYTADFKQEVVEYKLKHQLSLRQAAAHFGLGNSTQVGIWERQYYSGGIEALTHTKRKTSVIMTKKPKPTPPEDKEDALKSREQLLAELEYLRMENAYLKELEALQEQKRQSQRKKH